MSDQTDDPLRIITFGCRLNAYESEVMRGHARDGASDGRTIVFNTCAVTAEAERQARQAIRRVRLLAQALLHGWRAAKAGEKVSSEYETV